MFKKEEKKKNIIKKEFDKKDLYILLDNFHQYYKDLYRLNKYLSFKVGKSIRHSGIDSSCKQIFISIISNWGTEIDTILQIDGWYNIKIYKEFVLYKKNRMHLNDVLLIIYDEVKKMQITGIDNILKNLNKKENIYNKIDQELKENI